VASDKSFTQSTECLYQGLIVPAETFKRFFSGITVQQVHLQEEPDHKKLDVFAWSNG